MKEVSWQKVYELDLEARRKGDGKNYLTPYELEGNWSKTGSKISAHIESGYWYGEKLGLMDVVRAAGWAYASKEASGTSKVVDSKAASGAKLSKLKPDEINNMSLDELRNSIPDDWQIFENNGRVHIKDSFGTDRIKIDPPDKVTNYDHMHIFDADRNPLDINGNIVNRRSPEAHIPWAKK